MLQTDKDIQHGLAHIEIGEPAVVATIGAQRFSANALSNFFRELRAGHRDALASHSPILQDVVGHEEHAELDEFGIFGQFAGRLAVQESGLATIENVLHEATPPGLQNSLRASLAQSVNVLRAS